MSNPKLNLDEKELKHFESMADEWWDPNGKLKPLHQMNPVRIRYIKQFITQHFSLDPEKPKCFEGLKMLDVGCGGGLLAEPLARLGGRVTAIDAVEKNIKIASLHAQKSKLDIDYQYTHLEELPLDKKYDVISCLEVLEHVPDPALFVRELSKRLKEDGLLFLSTLNRTWKSYLFAIVGAEYLLRILPVGTHHWNKFLRPSEIVEFTDAVELETLDLSGMSYEKFKDKWSLSKDLSINYVCCFIKK